MSRSLLILREAEIRELLDLQECIEAVERAFAAYSTGQAELPAVINLDVPEHRGEIHVKAGHLRGGGHYAVKIASGFYDNPSKGLPQNDGMVLVFEAQTGQPAALLLDNGYITDLRTGAAGAVAARHLARRDARVVGVIGCGGQARFQLQALARVRPFREARIFGRRAERARACADDLASLPAMPPGARFRPVASAREAVEGADIVVTVTASREPIVLVDWLAPGTHITAVGSDGPDKQELHPEVLARADRLVADSKAQCLRLGEIHHGVASGAISENKVDAELGEIAAGLKPGRRSDSEITVCDLTGVGVQDVAAASLVIAQARAARRGERLAL